MTSLEHWRELCTAEDFLRVYGVVRHLVTTLPLLLHYKETVIESLLNALRKGRAAPVSNACRWAPHCVGLCACRAPLI